MHLGQESRSVNEEDSVTTIIETCLHRKLNLICWVVRPLCFSEDDVWSFCLMYFIFNWAVNSYTWGSRGGRRILFKKWIIWDVFYHIFIWDAATNWQTAIQTDRQVLETDRWLNVTHKDTWTLPPPVYTLWPLTFLLLVICRSLIGWVADLMQTLQLMISVEDPSR